MKTVVLVSRCAWTLYNFRAGLMRTLKQHGHAVFGAGAGGDGFEAQIESLGVPFVPLPIDKNGLNPWADVRLFWTLYLWYRRARPDVVHHFTIKPVIYGSLAARLAGVPRIINTVPGLGFVFMEDLPWLRRLVEWQYRVALACSHVTFFQNAEDRQVFVSRRLIAPEKTRLLPGSGVNTEDFAPRDEGQPQTNGAVTFLMVARLLREKGLYEFAEAARLVKHEFPEVRMQLLGRRDERNPTVVSAAELEGWQREGILTWLGEVEDVRPSVAQADVVVLPSYREGVPRSLLEAAAMGKAIIATDAVGCREVVEDGVNGVLVPVRNPLALANAMMRLIEKPDLRVSMGIHGRNKVKQEFDERLVIERILNVYERV